MRLRSEQLEVEEARSPVPLASGDANEFSDHQVCAVIRVGIATDIPVWYFSEVKWQYDFEPAKD